MPIVAAVAQLAAEFYPTLMPNPQKSISVCMHAMNRSWQVKQTLLDNIEACKQGHQLILVNYGSTDDLDDWVRGHCMDAINAGRLTYFYTRDPERFHASKSKNLAHRLATGEILINCDGDNFFGPADLRAIGSKFREDDNIIVQQFSGTHGDGTFGRLALRRTDFHLLGGYDEGLLPMAAQDDDLLLRAQMLGLRRVVIDTLERNPVANTTESKTPSGFSGPWKDMLDANVATMEMRQKVMGYRRENQFISFRGVLNCKQDIVVDGNYATPPPLPHILPESARHPAARPAEFNRHFQDFRAARDDSALRSSLERMHASWNNSWAGSPEFLWVCVQKARLARSAILECGPGLSSLVIAYCARVPVLSLEHDVAWHRDMLYLRNRFNLRNLHLVHVPLRAYGDYEWYDFKPPDKASFDLVICGGPAGNTTGGRYGLLPALIGHVPDRAVIILDDVQRAGEQEMLQRWGRIRPLQGSISTGANGKSYGIFLFKDAEKLSSRPGYTANISLLMPAWNAAHFLKQTLESCLAQTHADFEFIICDDGATDSTWEILNSCRDPRIRLLRNEKNMGSPYTRNRLLDAAAGRYIAWADADDIYHPERLARQLAFMEAHPDCAAVSACMNKIIGGQIRQSPQATQVNEHAVLRLAMLFHTPLNNPVAFVRADALDGLRFPTERRGGEDYWLWRQIAQHGGRLALLPDILCDYRIHSGQVSRCEQPGISELVREVKSGIFADVFHRPLSEEEATVHFDLVDPGIRVDVGDRQRIERLVKWVGQLTGWLPPGSDREIFSQLAIQALGKKGIQIRISG